MDGYTRKFQRSMRDGIEENGTVEQIICILYVYMITECNFDCQR